MKMRQFWPKSKAIALVFCITMTKIVQWLSVTADLQVMKMRQFWPKRKAIVVAFCLNMTKVDIG